MKKRLDLVIPRVRLWIPLKFILPKKISFKRTSKSTMTRSSRSLAITTRKFARKCFFCAKKGHRQNDYINRKKKEEVNINNANVIEDKIKEICAMVSEMEISMITETNMFNKVLRLVA